MSYLVALCTATEIAEKLVKLSFSIRSCGTNFRGAIRLLEFETLGVLRIKNATDELTDVLALTDVGRKTTKASRGSKEPLEVARETLGETMKTPGDAGETIVTPGDAKEPPTTATRSNMNGGSLGHFSNTKNTFMECRSDE